MFILLLLFYFHFYSEFSVAFHSSRSWGVFCACFIPSHQSLSGKGGSGVQRPPRSLGKASWNGIAINQERAPSRWLSGTRGRREDATPTSTGIPCAYPNRRSPAERPAAETWGAGATSQGRTENGSPQRAAGRRGPGSAQVRVTHLAEASRQTG